MNRISNCLFYVLRRINEGGGAVLIEKSSYGWWPHFKHVDHAGCITEFIPEERRKRMFPPPVFKGAVHICGIMVTREERENDAS